MSEFMNEPLLVLETIEDVRAVLGTPRATLCGLTGSDVYRIKSLWLVDLTREVQAKEYPYNSVIKKLACERLGLPAMSDAEYAREGDALSALIYNAQNYRRDADLRAAGYRPFSKEMIYEAFNEGKTLELLTTGLMGSSVKKLKAKQIGDDIYAIPEGKRKYHCAPAGQPVRFA